jgi:large subunit ribosomal protein L18
MTKQNRKVIPFKRKRIGKTDYKKRITLLLSDRPRLVIRKKIKNSVAQFVEYNEKGDKVLATASTRELVKLGWKYDRGNLPSAYLVGALAAKKAAAKGVKTAVLDVGLQKITPGGKIYAALKGAVDAGIEIPHDPSIFPSEDRITGKHIIECSKKLAKKQFKVDPAGIIKDFGEIKNKIMGAKK